MAKRIPLLLLLLCSLASNVGNAQYFRNSNYWKTHRTELTVGAGISNFLGELGGRDQIGAPFVWDLELSQTKPAINLGYRYHTFEKQALRANFTYGILAGNDNLTSEPFRQNRNLNFKTDIFEFSLLYEIHLFTEQLGHVYDLRGAKGEKSSRVGLYVFAGVGGFYFQPKTLLNGTFVELQPLGTEGQGLEGGPEEYKNFQVCIPMGVGLRKALSKQWSAGLELQYTKTFTDYIDDVSGVYFDNDVIAAERGDLAAYLADPNLDKVPGQTFAGQQRGDSEDLDAYLFLRVQFNYKIYKYKSSGKKYRTRIRRQKVVF